MQIEHLNLKARTMNMVTRQRKLITPKTFHLLTCYLMMLLLFLLPCHTSCLERQRTIQQNHHNNPSIALGSTRSSSGSDRTQDQYHSSPSSSSQSASSSSSSSSLSDQDSYDQTGSDEQNESLYQPPHDLEVLRLNDTSVVLRWYLPFSGDNNNAADHLQFFKIQYKSTKKEADWKTDNREIPPTTRAYQINGLRPGNYFFIVTAVYDNDDNVPSDAAKYRLRARSKINHNEMPEQKAPIIYWSNATSEYVRFKWTYKVKDKDMQTFGYLVYYRSAHAVSDFTIYNTLDENVEIVNLEPDTPYEAKVVAYNTVGVSEFSDIIRIKTKPRSNSTGGGSTSETGGSNVVSALITTTKKPQTSSITEGPTGQDQRLSSNQQSVTSAGTPGEPVVVGSGSRFITSTNVNSTVSKVPYSIAPITPPSKTQLDGSIQFSGNNNTNNTSRPPAVSFEMSFTATMNRILPDLSYLILRENQNDNTLAIRLALLVLLPIILVVSVLICLISCHHRRRKDSPASSTADSMQFDLEINSYFKNSFPGIEKEYSSSMPNNHNAHHGFVNNHPHINDFA